jgi:uncharacterized cupredoxin-like copper-binding protein
MKTVPSITLLLFFSLLALAACSAQESSPTALPPVEVTIVATDIAYDIPQIETAAGQTVRVILDNHGVLEHDFTIQHIPLSGGVTVAEDPTTMAGHDMGHVEEELDIHVAAPIGGTNTIEFTPSAPGEYPYYCTVPGHREAGMEGMLVVSDPS